MNPTLTADQKRNEDLAQRVRFGDSPITSEALKATGEFNLPDTPATPATDGLGAALEDVPDQFTQNLEQRSQQTEEAKDQSLNDLLTAFTQQQGFEQLTAQTQQEAGLQTLETDLLDINDQLRREELSRRRAVERIESRGGGLKSGAAAEVANINRQSFSKQADLAIVQLAAQGKYDSARRFAEQKAKALYEQQQNAIELRKFIYQEHKDLFSIAEQRQFEVELNNRERKLNNERADFEALQSAKLEALKMAQLNGAPVSVLQAIQTAQTPEEVFSAGGRYASVDLLDRAYKAAQLESLRSKPEALRPTSVIDQGGRKLLIDTQTGEVIKDFGVTDASVSELNQAVTQEKIKNIDSLKAHSALNSVVGPNPLARDFEFTTLSTPISPIPFPIPIDRFTGASSDFIASVDQLTKNLTLQNLIDAKANGATFGALSEGELKVLAESVTKINNWRVEDKQGNTRFYKASEKDFMAELDKISNFAKLDALKAGIEPDSIGVWEESGHYFTYNGDGTITQLK